MDLRAEQEWATSDNPLELFDLAVALLSQSDYKLRCVIGGTTSLLVDELPAKYRADAIIAIELLAEGVNRSPEIKRLRATFQKSSKLPPRVRRLLTFVVGGLGDDLFPAARNRVGEILSRPRLCDPSRVAAVLRCICGNPFRPVAFDPAWRTSDVVALARGIYEERAFDRMPILADALQDAGCDSDDILSHCRDTNTPHARGCWVVDLVLDKA